MAKNKAFKGTPWEKSEEKLLVKLYNAGTPTLEIVAALNKKFHNSKKVRTLSAVTNRKSHLHLGAKTSAEPKADKVPRRKRNGHSNGNDRPEKEQKALERALQEHRFQYATPDATVEIVVVGKNSGKLFKRVMGVVTKAV